MKASLGWWDAEEDMVTFTLTLRGTGPWLQNVGEKFRGGLLLTIFRGCVPGLCTGRDAP